MVGRRHKRRNDIRIPEYTVQLSREVIRAESDGFVVRRVGRYQKRHLLHQHGVSRNSQIKRIQHHITGYLVHLPAVQIHRQGERCGQAFIRQGRRIEMAAAEVEIHFRVFLAEVYHAVKSHIQMRVFYSELTLIPSRLQLAVYMQIRVGVVIIGKLPHIGFHRTKPPRR